MLHFGVMENTPRLLPLLSKITHVHWMDASETDAAFDALLVIHPRGEIPVSGTLLLPDEFAGQRSFPAAQVVSYGLSPKSSLTLSSVEEEHLVVALQRELVTLTGQRVERQEFFCPEILGREATLAIAGALLIAGAPPEKLYNGMKKILDGRALAVV